MCDAVHCNYLPEARVTQFHNLNYLFFGRALFSVSLLRNFTLLVRGRGRLKKNNQKNGKVK